jgi:hypothetical protein
MGAFFKRLPINDAVKKAETPHLYPLPQGERKDTAGRNSVTIW